MAAVMCNIKALCALGNLIIREFTNIALSSGRSITMLSPSPVMNKHMTLAPKPPNHISSTPENSIQILSIM